MKRKKINIILLGIFFSIYAIILFGKTVVYELRSADFLSTKGTILSTEIISETTTTDIPMSGVTFSIVYYPKISFEYNVNDMKLRGDRYSISIKKYRDKKKVERILSKYPAGSLITVWYDPEDPTFAILNKKITIIPWIGTIIALIYLMIVLFWWPAKFVAKKKRRKGDSL